ncbi:MAG: 3,4-dihydroxy-2-butanone-4-phosphate synthase [Promethearchaeota archaeon]|nr:MAG: 3,4-dihydroxy-2-butanone-4-phosphate synthase [Candidatus Lokiarchaeota archaeon]
MIETIERAIKELSLGNFILVYDLDGREEEVDLVCLAEKVTPNHIKNLRYDAGGLICVAMHAEIAEKLGLPFMLEIYLNVLGQYSIFNKISPNVACPYGDKPSFSITINHIDTYTGITDNDRALTIREFGILGSQIYQNGIKNEEYREIFGSNFRAPGHTHLLIANPDLLKERLGHTELTVTLAFLGDLSPLTVLCEMLDGSTGKALSIKKAREYANKNNLIMVEGEQIVEAYNEYLAKVKN